jgi:uncharacterized protein (DUF1778 family)
VASRPPRGGEHGTASLKKNDNVITLDYLAGMKHESPTDAAKRSTLNIRITPEERGLIDEAARVLGKTRTDFILDAARRMAEDTLLDRTLIKVSPEVHAEFLAKLDAPPQPNERLVRLMNAPLPWKTK